MPQTPSNPSPEDSLDFTGQESSPVYKETLESLKKLNPTKDEIKESIAVLEESLAEAEAKNDTNLAVLISAKLSAHRQLSSEMETQEAIEKAKAFEDPDAARIKYREGTEDDRRNRLIA